ncbi:MAG TPA: ThiF family adenylyltransferase [Anaerohalosphaeraceae bacterium]|nr:ThiF family adenylyltransferase [Anaerohalosphaeraceae bacterium]
MNRLKKTETSVLGRLVRIRFARLSFEALYHHLNQDDSREQFAYALFNLARTADGTVLIVSDIFIPDPEDLIYQGSTGVTPNKNLQFLVYFLAQQKQCGILDIHTHPFEKIPHFSSIDEAESLNNAKDICRLLPPPETHAMIVFGQGIQAHDSVVYDRSLNGYRTIEAIEVLGRKSEIRHTGQSHDTAEISDPTYDRQIRIRDWSQKTLAQQNIAIIGVGGNGAHILQTLISIGAGTEGWIAVIDPDTVEPSNLPRIPYATPRDIGQPKVTVATRYALDKNPNVKFYPYPCSVTAKAALDRIKAATILIGAGDRDSVRKICNENSVKYMIPYIDLGCDIHMEDNSLEAAGQVRIVLPGQNACLVCCGGFDPSSAALELMDDLSALQHASLGYGQGKVHHIAPSVANLNASIAQLGISAFLSLVHGPTFGNWDFVHFSQLNVQMTAAQTRQNEKCPVCCREGVLAIGDNTINQDKNNLQIPTKFKEKQA